MVIDSSIWLEIFIAGKLKELCKKQIGPNTVVPSLVYFEVYKCLKQKFSEPKALEAMGVLQQYNQVDLTPEIALLAGDLSIEYKLPMADSLILAHAQNLRLTLITLDNDFMGISGVKILR